ncbi:MAG: hypothetical protein O2845_04120 [Proteobacteria bacterium]|nr:hypothetical protein [Pseudomonadota bacterium]
MALNLFAKAQSSETAAGERYACLQAAHGILAMLVSIHDPAQTAVSRAYSHRHREARTSGAGVESSAGYF